MNELFTRLMIWLTAKLITGFAKTVTGLRAIWSGTQPQAWQTLYFANHSSHGDFVLVWASLPKELRSLTRPVAGADYWMKSALRTFVGKSVFNALMIARDGSVSTGDPVQQMVAALRAGDSLIMFPEGTRNTTDEVLLPLKSGLYHIAKACPEVRLVPVWIENLKRVLPKGTLLPIPLECSVRFGAPIVLADLEEKSDFLARATIALLDLRPDYDRGIV